MGMDNKSTRRIMGITQEAIRSTRYRILQNGRKYKMKHGKSEFFINVVLRNKFRFKGAMSVQAECRVELDPTMLRRYLT